MEAEYTNIGRTEDTDPTLPLFHDIRHILDSQGAIESSENVIVIFNNPAGIPSDKVPVKVEWVRSAVRNGIEFYSPLKEQFLSGVVLGVIGVSDLDYWQVQSIFSEVHKYGGQTRMAMKNDVTHVLCTSKNLNVLDNGPKYFVIPQWFDHCLSLKYRFDEEIYQFPDPTFNETIKIYNHPSKSTLDSIKKIKSKALQGAVILLASDIEYPTEQFKKDLPKCIKKAGDQVVYDRNNSSVSIIITQYRTSDECILGWRDNKIVGSLWWLTNTMLREKLASPLSSLLDYPVPKNGIIEMDTMRIAVTGSNMKNLQFLTTLIQYSGGIYDIDMSKSCTYLISGKSSGSRYEEAKRRGMIVVNQLWLEESYQQWKVMPVNHSRYSI